MLFLSSYMSGWVEKDASRGRGNGHIRQTLISQARVAKKLEIYLKLQTCPTNKVRNKSKNSMQFGLKAIRNNSLALILGHNNFIQGCHFNFTILHYKNPHG